MHTDSAAWAAFVRTASARGGAPSLDFTLLARLHNGSVRNEKTGCLEWQHLRRSGYGVMSFRGKLSTTHRLSYEAHFGPIPDGLYVCHACDNPCCIAIEHLFLGTAKQNVDDMHRKGRARCGTAVLNEPLVAEMKRRFVLGARASEVAKAFDLAYATVHAVKNGETWKRVPPAARPMPLAGRDLRLLYADPPQRPLEFICPDQETPHAQHQHAGGGSHALSRLRHLLRRLGRAAWSLYRASLARWRQRKPATGTSAR